MPGSMTQVNKSLKTTEGTYVNTSVKMPPRASRDVPPNSKYSYVNTNKRSDSQESQSRNVKQLMSYYMSFNKNQPVQTHSEIKANNSSVNIYVRTSQEDSIAMTAPTNKSFFLGIADGKAN